jgi:hypothetical protein
VLERFGERGHSPAEVARERAGVMALQEAWRRSPIFGPWFDGTLGG